MESLGPPELVSSEERAGRRMLDPEGFGGWYLVSPDMAVSMGRLPPAADCGCCHLGSGEREGVTGQVGETEAPSQAFRDLSHRILSTLSALLLLLHNKNRRFPRPAARRAEGGLPAHDVLLNQPWGPGVRNWAQGCFAEFPPVGPERPGERPEGGHPSDPLLRQGLEDT